jgi:hypothetical protein
VVVEKKLSYLISSSISGSIIYIITWLDGRLLIPVACCSTFSVCFLISSLHLQRTKPAHQPVPNVDTRLDFPSVVLLVLAGRRPLAVFSAAHRPAPSANMYDSAAAKALQAATASSGRSRVVGLGEWPLLVKALFFMNERRCGVGVSKLATGVCGSITRLTNP